MLPDIGELVLRELDECCPSCIHQQGCVFRKHSEKVVIQCEQYEAGVSIALPARGLCLNCEKAPHCRLPKETSGVWHCEEYE